MCLCVFEEAYEFSIVYKEALSLSPSLSKSKKKSKEKAESRQNRQMSIYLFKKETWENVKTKTEKKKNSKIVDCGLIGLKNHMTLSLKPNCATLLTN